MYGNNLDESQKKYVTCPHCGEQILMVPVLADMIKSIESHLETHKECNYPEHGPFKHPRAVPENEGLDLPEQVLMRAAEIGETLGKEPEFPLRLFDKAQ